MRDDSYVEISIDRPAQALDRPFTYRLPARLRGAVQLGSYVLVPFGGQQLCGFVTAFSGSHELDEGTVRDVEAVLGDLAFFDEAMLTVARKIARYYRCLLIDVLRCMLPEGLTQRVERVVTWSGNEELDKSLEKLERVAPAQHKVLQAIGARGGTVTVTELKQMLESGSTLSGILRALTERGLIATETVLEPPRVAVKYVNTAALTVPHEMLEAPLEELRAKAPKQARCLEILMAAGRPLAVAELVKQAETSHAAVAALERRELVRLAAVESRRLVDGGGGGGAGRHELMPQQERALESIAAELSAAEPRPILLHGITASGKTEVYLRVIADVLERGRQAIVLVPEISLTVQTIDVFRSRFGDRVAILHSALGAGERFDEWRRVALGQVDICVGARSAVFAPFRRLGLVVVDEEHEPSYKQDSTPRYHARQVALWRAEASGAAVLLGSATPSVETYWRARQGKVALVDMPERVGGRPLAQVEILDLCEATAPGPAAVTGPLHPRLVSAIRDRIERREQVILFLNRRGYAPILTCTGCGHVVCCEHCDVSLVVHADRGLLQCHHCDYQMPIATDCLNCGREQGYRNVGFGTERLEQWLGKVMPEARLLRMDRDTTRRKNAHAQILSRFRAGDADILLGTQMVAKGLDFETVTLVGVVAADVALRLPDFRAAERTFQLLCQVSGRAGRGARRGVVMIQTRCPDHPAIRAAETQDYVNFAESELADREAAGYPPFCHLARLLVAHEHEAEAELRAERLAQRVAESYAEAEAWGELLGPAPAPLAKIRDQFRFHLLVKTPGAAMLQRIMDALEPKLDGLREGLTIDVDPVSVL